MECPKCQTNNTEDSQFCKKCATPFPGFAEAVPTKTLETPTEELRRGSVFAGRYEIIEELGKGGMGRVYRVFDKKVDGEIALKLVKPEIASDKNTVERFRNELKLARDITHKNVCRMYDLNEDKGTHYITMEYVPGGDLKRFIRRSKQLGIGTALSIAKQICDGLVEAHRLGVVHRDLKPNNIMIDDNGNARIMDFGIARSLSAKGITGKGVMIGTPEYMSPEQVEGKEVDQRSDIYSLGIILYEMVTGRVPFEGDTHFVIGVKHKSEKPKEPKEFNSQISDDLNLVILRCLEKEKENRYKNAEEVLSVLNQIEQGIPTTERAVPKSKPITSKEITVRFTPKRLFIPAALILVIAVVAFIIFKKQAFRLDPNRVVVAFFENRTGNDVYNQLVQYAASTIADGISQTGMFDVVPFDAVMHFIEAFEESKGENQRIPIIRQLARETGAGTEITGYFSLIRDILSFHVEIIDVSSGTSLVPVTRTEGSKEEQGKIIDELSEKISGALASHFNFDYVKAYDYRPPNYAAFREYQSGFELVDIDSNQSIQHFKSAIEQDPTYLQPYLSLLHIYVNRSWFDEAQTIISYLGENRDQLSLLNRHRLDSHIARLEGNNDEVAYHYQEALKLDPRSRLIRYLVCFWAPYANRPKEVIKVWKDFGDEFVQAADLFPGSVQDTFARIARAYHMLGLYRQELRVIRQGEKYFPDSFHEHEARVMAALGKVDEVERILEKSRAISSQDINPGRIMFATTQELREHGHLDAYKEIANQTVDLYDRLLEQEPTDRMRLSVAEALYMAERWDEAQPLFEELSSEFPNILSSPGNRTTNPLDSITCMGYLGVLSARKGDREKALQISVELKNIDQPYLFGRHTQWRARIASLLDEREEAYRLLRDSLMQGRCYDIHLLYDMDFEPLRDYKPFQELLKPKE